MIKTTMTVNEAQNQFSDLLRRAVEKQEMIVIKQEGEPEVVLLSMAQYLGERKTHEWEQIWANLDALWADMTDSSPDDLPSITEMIRQMREERDVQLTANLY